ncbi:transposase [soil metagenome]
MTEPRFLDPQEEVVQHRSRLPHWQQDGATYFVTFRLADSLPHHLLEQWREQRAAWLRFHPQPLSTQDQQQLHARFSYRLEHWLDEAHGSCLLRGSSASAAVVAVLLRFDAQSYSLHSFVIMPNHVHVLFSLASRESLQMTMKTWKGVSARELNARHGTSGSVWQKDYFDRMIRDTQHFWRAARYIRRNPAKAGLNDGKFHLHESDRIRTALDGEGTPLSPDSSA